MFIVSIEIQLIVVCLSYILWHCWIQLLVLDVFFWSILVTVYTGEKKFCSIFCLPDLYVFCVLFWLCCMAKTPVLCWIADVREHTYGKTLSLTIKPNVILRYFVDALYHLEEVFLYPCFSDCFLSWMNVTFYWTTFLHWLTWSYSFICLFNIVNYIDYFLKIELVSHI